MRWPTPCKSPKMSWRNSRRPLPKLVSHSEEGTLLLPAVRLKRISPTPASSGASRTWAVCCSRDLLHAKKSLGSLVASGLSLLAREHKGRDGEPWQTALPCCSRVGFVVPGGRRNIQTGIALFWPGQHFRACRVLGSDDGGFGSLAELCYISGLCGCI